MDKAAGGLLQVVLPCRPGAGPPVLKARNSLLIAKENAGVLAQSCQDALVQNEKKHQHDDWCQQESDLGGVIFRQPDAEADKHEANDELGGNVEAIALPELLLCRFKNRETALVFLLGALHGLVEQHGDTVGGKALLRMRTGAGADGRGFKLAVGSVLRKLVRQLRER